MRNLRIVAIGLVGLVGVAACGGGGGSSSKSSAATQGGTTGPTTTVLGHDQANSSFCQTLSQLTKNPNAAPAAAKSLIHKAAQEAPADLQADVNLLATFVDNSIGVATTVAPTPDESSKLLAALTRIGTYANAHCGISLHLGP
jgi:hypothetical protein